MAPRPVRPSVRVATKVVVAQAAVQVIVRREWVRVRISARPGLALESAAGGGRVAAIEGTISRIAIEEVLTRLRCWAVRLEWHPRGAKAAPGRLRLEGDGHAVQVLPPRDATVGERVLAAADEQLSEAECRTAAALHGWEFSVVSSGDRPTGCHYSPKDISSPAFFYNAYADMTFSSTAYEGDYLGERLSCWSAPMLELSVALVW